LTLPVVCGHTQVRASLEDVANFFTLDNVAKRKAYGHVTAQEIFDSQTLYVLSQRTSVEPLRYVGIQWFASHAPLGIFNRDYCVLEVRMIFYAPYIFM
jgi:hypothetical protein